MLSHSEIISKAVYIITLDVLLCSGDRQFQLLLSEHGPQEPSSERVLNLFLALTTHERKVIMTAGSIKGFLSQQGVVALDGNTMLLRDDFKIQSSGKYMQVRAVRGNMHCKLSQKQKTCNLDLSPLCSFLCDWC